MPSPVGLRRFFPSSSFPQLLVVNQAVFPIRVRVPCELSGKQLLVVGRRNSEAILASRANRFRDCCLAQAIHYAVRASHRIGKRVPRCPAILVIRLLLCIYLVIK